MRPMWCIRIFLNLFAIIGGIAVACTLYFKIYTSDDVKGNYVKDNDSTGIKRAPLGKNTRTEPMSAPGRQSSNTLPVERYTDNGSYLEYRPHNPELTFKIDKSFKPSTCPTALQKKMTNQTWTSKIFRPQVQTVMHTGVVNREEYDRLMPYNMPFGFRYLKDNMSYDELYDVLKLFPEDNSMFDFSNKPRPECISCAVVGNGGILNGSKMGKEIDSHDMVFRVNHCVRRGYEEDVGTRTTHYVLMDRSLVHTAKEDIPNEKGIRYIFLPCRKADFKYIRDTVKEPDPRRKFQTNAKNVRILHPDFVRFSHKVWESTRSFRPTTGGMMLFTALNVCDRVSVYGMGFTRQYSEHYYDKKFLKFRDVRGSHDFRKEIKIMKDLDRDGTIRWYKRDVREWLR